MIPNWPSTLPKFFLADGYEETPVMPRASFESDVGPPIERPKGTYRMSEIVCSTIMYHDQLIDFEAFVANDLGQGTLPFYGTHPRLETTVKFKVRSDGGVPYRIVPSGIQWRVSFVLMVLS